MSIRSFAGLVNAFESVFIKFLSFQAQGVIPVRALASSPLVGSEGYVL